MWYSPRLRAVCFALLACASGLGCRPEPAAPNDEADEHDEAPRGASAHGLGVVHGALASGAVRSIDGTYGTCLGPGKAGTGWSVSLGGTPTFGALSVVKNDAACRLTLTRFHTATATYTASAPISLTLTPGSTPTLFTSVDGGVFATATVDTLSYAASTVAVTLFTGDTRFISSSNPARYTFDAQVLRDAPLSYWRLSEAVSTVSQDLLNDTDLVDLRHHGAANVSWTLHASASTAGAAAVFDHNYVRAVGSAKTAVYSASTAPPASGDYEVSAIVRVASLLPGTTVGVVDQAGVLGRLSTSNFTGYFAGLVTRATVCLGACAVSREWVLRKYVNGTLTQLGSKSAADVDAGRSYTLGLRMRGTTLEVLVDGVSAFTALDASIATAGSAGLLLGGGTAATAFNVGTLIDSVELKTLAYTAYDSVGVNHGTHSHNVASAEASALTGAVSSANGALRLGGANHLSITRDMRIGSGDFSLEFWFKYAGGAASTVTAWYFGLGMVDANASVLGADGFGVSMRTDGRVMAGAACGALCLEEATILTSASYGDDQWHHVVFTRKHTDGVLTLYVDAVPTTAVGPINRSLLSLSTLNVGRLQIQLLGLIPLTTNYFVGALDELAVYDKVLSSARVAAHYQARSY